MNHDRKLLRRIAAVLATIAILVGGWFAAKVYWFHSWVGERDAIICVVRSWQGRAPSGVSDVFWRDACSTVATLVINATAYSVSLSELGGLRAEVEERSKQDPINADTLEWLVFRLGETGPEASDYVTRQRPSWEYVLNRVRAESAGLDVEAIFLELDEWRTRFPPGEESEEFVWHDVLDELQTAVVRIYGCPDTAGRPDAGALRAHVDALSAQPITPDTLRTVARHLAESSDRGAEYLQRTEYLLRYLASPEVEEANTIRGAPSGTRTSLGTLDLQIELCQYTLTAHSNCWCAFGPLKQTHNVRDGYGSEISNTRDNHV